MLTLDPEHAEKNAAKKKPMNRLHHQDRATKIPAARPDEVPRWKRVLDVALVLITLPLVLPVMICIALLIWIVSEGPVLFRQERIGYLGRRFTCFKFRTMPVATSTALPQRALET